MVGAFFATVGFIFFASLPAVFVDAIVGNRPLSVAVGVVTAALMLWRFRVARIRRERDALPQPPSF